MSSSPSKFNVDFNVGIGPDRTDRPQVGPLMYNFEETDTSPIDEMHGISVFAKDEDGVIYHTYSAYGRGLETAERNPMG